MSKPIVLTEEYIKQVAEEFISQLRASKLSDGKITYTKTFKYEESDKVSVLFTPMAYTKMLTLLNGFDTEVAWHGLVERRSKNEFLIYDIVVYPQEVTGVTANTDQEEYQKWLIALDDDTANAMHMQGHSHVRMSTNPSQTDLTYWDAILQQVPANGYYIFMIFNQRMEHTVKVYDREQNTLYEGKDIVLAIDGDEPMGDFLAGAKKLVRTRAASAPYSYKAQDTKVDKKSKKCTIKTDKTGTIVQTFSDYADDDDSVPRRQQSNYLRGYGSSGVQDFDEYIFGRPYIE